MDIFCLLEIKVYNYINYLFDKMKCIYLKCKYGFVIYSNYDDVEIFFFNIIVLEIVFVVVKEILIVFVYVVLVILWIFIVDDIKSVI